MPPRITRAQAHTLKLLGAPLDQDVGPPPAQRKARDPNAPVEWRIQATFIKAVRARMVYDKTLRYMVNLIENHRDPGRAAVAKMMGMQRGVPDIWLLRQWPATSTSRASVSICVVEVKVPGRHLTPEQEDWFAWLTAGGIPCHCVDDLAEFIKILEGF